VTFEEFAAARLPAVLKFAAVLTGDRGLAEDVVQEVLIRANARWHMIGSLPRPEAYVRKMIVNEYLTWRRRSWRLVLSGAGSDIDGLPAPDPAAGYAEREAMLAELASCPGGSARWWCCATTRACPIRRSPRSWAARRAPSAVTLPGRWPRSGSS
jgi:DNA-directed RNA polymerase specialized sigma24 family protein